MQDVRRYVLLGEHHRVMLEQRMIRAVHQWSDRWLRNGISEGSLAVEIVTSPQSDALPTSGREVRLGDTALLWLPNPTPALEGLVQWIGGASPARSVPAGPDSGFTAHLGWTLLLSLLADLFDTDAAQFDAGTDAELPDGVIAKGSGTARVTLRAGALSLDLLLSSGAVQKLVPTPIAANKKRMPAVLSREKAVAMQPVHLRAGIEVEEGLTLDVIRDLVEGDVILFDQTIEAGWSVYGPDGEILGSCRPGRVGDQLAVRLAAARPRR